LISFTSYLAILLSKKYKVEIIFEAEPTFVIVYLEESYVRGWEVSTQTAIK